MVLTPEILISLVIGFYIGAIFVLMLVDFDNNEN